MIFRLTFSVVTQAAPLAMSGKKQVRNFLEGYVFGSANDHHLPKHKLKGSQVSIGIMAISPSQTSNGHRR